MIFFFELCFMLILIVILVLILLPFWVLIFVVYLDNCFWQGGGMICHCDYYFGLVDLGPVLHGMIPGNKLYCYC